MRSHVFIVNEETLPIHLKYGFVGTTSGETKDNNIGLLADMKRVKKGDLVFFYIEGRGSKKGRFFGTFQIKDEEVLHAVGDDAFRPSLPLRLIYRRRIIPYEVFPKGVQEWEVLDKLPTYARELIWSLIYRKMKALRGNTMLFPWETQRLLSLIRNANQNKSIKYDSYYFDDQKYEICKGEGNGSLENNSPVVIDKSEIYRGESYFQAYLLQNLKVGINDFLPEIFGSNITWIGNEVFAGSSMQKVDMITICEVSQENFEYRLIELKHFKSSPNISNAPAQLDYYINWARDDIGGHLKGAMQFNVKPILLILSKSPYLIPPDISKDFSELGKISYSPEIWELDTDLHSRKLI